jgi:hypothetical protein
MDSEEYDVIIRHLVQIATHQEAINDDLREFNRQQTVLNQQQAEFNADTRTTLARLETLLARMLRHEDNGREA